VNSHSLAVVRAAAIQPVALSAPHKELRQRAEKMSALVPIDKVSAACLPPTFVTVHRPTALPALFAGAHRSDGAAEIDQARRFLPSERVCRGAAAPRKPHDRLSVPVDACSLAQNASQWPALPANEPSSRHSVPRTQIAACWTPRESMAHPTIVWPSRLTPVAVTPPAKMTPVVASSRTRRRRC
jgi:hypothetical protein